MTATAEPPVPATEVAEHPPLTRGEGVASLARAEGVELLGPIHGSGYRDGAALVRRADGQMVQLGPLMYALLECADGSRERAGLAAAVSQRLGRRLDEEHVDALADKLAAQGLLAGAALEGPGHRPGPDPPADRAIHVPVLTLDHVACPGGLRRRVLVRPLP